MVHSSTCSLVATIPRREHLSISNRVQKLILICSQQPLKSPTTEPINYCGCRPVSRTSGIFKFRNVYSIHFHPSPGGLRKVTAVSYSVLPKSFYLQQWLRTIKNFEK